MRSNLQEFKSKIAKADYFVIVEDDLSTLTSKECPEDLGIFGWAITREEIIVWHKAKDEYNTASIERTEFYVHPKLAKRKRLGEFLWETK